LEVNGSRIDDGRGMATPPGVPVKPDWIEERPIASAKWDETIAELQEIPGLLSTLDGDALALYCSAWQTLNDAQALISQHGLIAKGSGGAPYAHPAVSIANRARAEIVKLGALFGLNPVAREGMIVPGPTDDDELADLIR
jgi:P27 family predicted phage terminase small subunit